MEFILSKNLKIVYLLALRAMFSESRYSFFSFSFISCENKEIPFMITTEIHGIFDKEWDRKSWIVFPNCRVNPNF